MGASDVVLAHHQAPVLCSVHPSVRPSVNPQHALAASSTSAMRPSAGYPVPSAVGTRGLAVPAPCSEIKSSNSASKNRSITTPGGWDAKGNFYSALPAPAAQLSTDTNPTTHTATQHQDNQPPPQSLALSSKNLVTVNLDGLPEQLVSLSIAANALTSVDLGPLQATPALTALILNSNVLTSIDLSPLVHTPALERLWLHNNALTSIDLSPLRHCKNLRSLYLDANKIDRNSVDLSPLAACPLLRALRLGKNNLAGELDITPILACSALSTLDVCASVKLSARVPACGHSSNIVNGGSMMNAAAAAAAAGTLPPALRRRAATVHWTVDEPNEPGTDSDVDGQEQEPDVLAGFSDMTQHERRVQLDGRALSENMTKAVLHQSDSLEDLAEMCSKHQAIGTYAALLIGFRGTSRFAVEALLEEQGGLATSAVASQEACNAQAIFRTGAFTSCSVMIVRSHACSLVANLRMYDASLPIIVVGNARETAEHGADWVARGATCYLTEPLCPRDAVSIRSMAHQRARQMSSRKRSPSPPQKGQKLSVEQETCRLARVLTRSGDVPPVRQDGVDNEAAARTSLRTDNKNGLGCKSSPPIKHAPTNKDTTCNPHSTSSTHRGSCSGPGVMTLALPASTRASNSCRSSSKQPESRRRLRPTLDFTCLRARVNGVITTRTNRVEDSAISMVFSRCGGRAFSSDFGSIATLCGLPVCAGSALHAATRVWAEISSGCKSTSPALSPVSIMDFGSKDVSYSPTGMMPTYNKIGAAHDNKCGGMSDFCRSPVPEDPVYSFGKNNPRVMELIEATDISNRLKEGVSYTMFHDFWSNNLCNRDCETRLFNVLRVAHRCECIVPIEAVKELAVNFVTNRSSDQDQAQKCRLAASLLCYELKGISWRSIGRHDLRRSRLCGSLLAAESGMFDGVAVNLRADRMDDIRSAFAAAAGKRIGKIASLSIIDVIWINSERGLLTPRAVEAIFKREIANGCMDIGQFAPMWLSATNPESRSACEYLFGILDADEDGYINAMDAAHFYSEKRHILLQDGYVSTAFEHVWRALLDSVAEGSIKSASGRLQVSMTDLRRIGARDWTNLFQSLLFIDDDLAMVDPVRTAQHALQVQSEDVKVN